MVYNNYPTLVEYLTDDSWKSSFTPQEVDEITSQFEEQLSQMSEPYLYCLLENIRKGGQPSCMD